MNDFKNKVIHGDSLIELKSLPENSIDSIVTDPPYELGFMGKSWDSTGIANNVEFWKECLRVLKPGGHLLSFGGTRTYHRMASAIEDAGFEVRDMIEWVYGSGFPKSLNIGKAVDKLQGNEREDLGESENNRDRSNHEYNSVGNVGIGTDSPTAKLHINNITTANTILIEDSTNPDSSPFVINSGGSVSIGTTSVFSVGGAETKLNV